MGELFAAAAVCGATAGATAAALVAIGYASASLARRINAWSETRYGARVMAADLITETEDYLRACAERNNDADH